MGPNNNRIWIDLDNSPHVPFFKPIIPALQARGFEIYSTARDAYQVCELAAQADLDVQVIGHHYGKFKAMKAYGTLFRAAQLLPTGWRRKPAIALSHGSRSHLIAAKCLRIPAVVMGDYEHSTSIPILSPDWLITPEVIKQKENRDNVLTYPGIKEDIYVPDFQPKPGLRDFLGVKEDSIMVTIRPPATAAHYHNPQSEILFSEAVDLVLKNPQTQIVILPRTIEQEREIRNRWNVVSRGGRVIIPEQVVDGLNLIWFSDFIISGGGTMNREAAALGVLVYSIFRGTTGAVDRYLKERGRLIMLETVEEVRERLDIRKQPVREWIRPADHKVLNCVIDEISHIVQSYE